MAQKYGKLSIIMNAEQRNTILFVTVHIAAVYAFIVFPYSTHKLTFLWALATYVYYGCGVTAGVHRYWTHRSYKANLPLRIIMAIGYYGAGMFTIYDWVLIHRVHHKFTDTDADPHNVNRGFFFSHAGWFLQKKHPEYYKRRKEIDMSDIKADSVVAFGDKYFYVFGVSFGIILPTLIPVFLWNETWRLSILQTIMRLVMVYNGTFLVNSAAHMFGSKPFDKNIMPSENLFVSCAALGEGWHNFHHVFPWDYRTGGLGKFDYNPTTFVINQFAKIGWTYDLKTASDDLIRKTCEKRGDGSYTNIWTEVPEPK